MKIPVFLSCPTVLSSTQAAARKLIVEQLDQLGLEPRAIGRSDYPADFPLREVLILARHCSGGVVLGFEQFVATSGTWKEGTEQAESIQRPVAFSTPWNQIEAAILFSLQKPVLIFRDARVQGGVFDRGVADVFIQEMPDPYPCPEQKRTDLHGLFLRWQEKVRRAYYGE